MLILTKNYYFDESYAQLIITVVPGTKKDHNNIRYNKLIIII